MNRLFLATLLVTSITMVYADNLRAVDVDNFDIVGVKLGMSPAQAKATLAKYFHISENQIRITSKPAGVVHPITKEKGGEQWLSYIDKKSHIRVVIHTYPRVPLEQNESAWLVSRIDYIAPMADEGIMKKEAFTQYGKASVDNNTHLAEWCKKPQKDTQGLFCKDNDSYLILKNSRLSLIGNRYKQAVMSYGK